MYALILPLIVNSAMAVGHALHNASPNAEKYTYPPQKISLKGARDIKIIGVRGHLKVRGNPHLRNIRLKVQHTQGKRSEDWHLSVERRRKTLFLEVFNVAYGREWRKQVREDLWPEFDIEIEAPSKLPLTVSWREGQLEFVNWDGDIEATFLKGEAHVRGGKGQVALNPIAALVSVRDHSGPLKIKGESGRVSLVRSKSDLDLTWLNGMVTLDDCQGKMRVESAAGDVSVRGGKGELGLHLGKGVAKILGFSGAVEGWGDKTKWEVAASAPADLNITTGTGPVRVNWLTGGAKVFLTSNRGTIQFPKGDFLKIGDREGRRVVEGVKLSKTMGQVFIRTDSGQIRWR